MTRPVGPVYASSSLPSSRYDTPAHNDARRRLARASEAYERAVIIGGPEAAATIAEIPEALRAIANQIEQATHDMGPASPTQAETSAYEQRESKRRLDALRGK